MIEKIVKFAKEKQEMGKILVRLDIQFNYQTSSYKGRAFYSDDSCYDIFDCDSVNIVEVK